MRYVAGEFAPNSALTCPRGPQHHTLADVVYTVTDRQIFLGRCAACETPIISTVDVNHRPWDGRWREYRVIIIEEP